MEMSGPIDALRREGIAFLTGAARTRAEAVEIAARFGTVQDAEEVNMVLPDDPERPSDPDPATGSDRSVGALDLHTDSSQADVPLTYISLYCERADPTGGGATTWLHVDDILQSLAASEEGRAAHELLASVEVPFALPEGVTPRLKWFPVLGQGAAGTTIRYAGQYIRFGVIEAEEAGRPLPAEVLSALRVFQRTIRETPPRTRSLAPGDIVVIDNHRVMHGRTAINDTATRLLWRTRLGSGAPA